MKTWKPSIYALLAFAYIFSLVTLGSAFFNVVDEDQLELSVFMPMLVLSVLVLSVAIMGYLFFAEGIRQYIDGKKKQAVKTVLQTIGTFAGITAILIAIIFATSV